MNRTAFKVLFFLSVLLIFLFYYFRCPSNYDQIRIPTLGFKDKIFQENVSSFSRKIICQYLFNFNNELGEFSENKNKKEISDLKIENIKISNMKIISINFEIFGPNVDEIKKIIINIIQDSNETISKILDAFLFKYDFFGYNEKCLSASQTNSLKYFQKYYSLGFLKIEIEKIILRNPGKIKSKNFSISQIEIEKKYE